MYDNLPQMNYPAQAELADFSQRLFAYIIDSVILAVVLGVLSLFSRAFGGLLIGFILQLIYQGYFLTQKEGQTPGKRIMGIRVVKLSGDPLTIGDAFVRLVGYYLDGLTLLIGALWALWDNQRQALHDKIASTIVVRA